MALAFNFTYEADVPAAARDVVAEVANYFSSLFDDPTTINVTVDWGGIEGLGESSTSLFTYTYHQITNALTSDSSSSDDSSTVADLPASDPISGAHTWSLTSANAKALDLIAGNASASDGTMTFSNSVAFDFDNSNGVTAGQYDFYGVVAHELTEIMGRSLNSIGNNVAFGDGYHPLDLFKYSGMDHVFVGTTAGYFSVDNGVTNLANFDTNPDGDFGDWASGINDSFLAFASSGVVEPVSAFDLSELDVIGWDRVAPVAGQVLTGGPGDDALFGGAGDDTIYGEAGNDFMAGNAGNDLLIGDTGDDIGTGGDGDDTLYGGPGNDNLLGDAGNDILVGEDGNDILQGGTGNDFLYGGAGNDQPYGGAGDDSISGGDGNDIIVLEGGNDTGLGDAGNDYIYGGNGNDAIYGGAGYDVLIGEAGNDVLFGGGAQGTADYLFGGPGADIFVVQNLAGASVIEDFNRAEGDIINLQGTGLNSFADVLSHTSDFGSFSVITIDPVTNIWVIGQTSATFHASDFAFS